MPRASAAGVLFLLGRNLAKKKKTFTLLSLTFEQRPYTHSALGDSSVTDSAPQNTASPKGPHWPFRTEQIPISVMLVEESAHPPPPIIQQSTPTLLRKREILEIMKAALPGWAECLEDLFKAMQKKPEVRTREHVSRIWKAREFSPTPAIPKEKIVEILAKIPRPPEYAAVLRTPKWVSRFLPFVLQFSWEANPGSIKAR